MRNSILAILSAPALAMFLLACSGSNSTPPPAPVYNASLAFSPSPDGPVASVPPGSGVFNYGKVADTLGAKIYLANTGDCRISGLTLAAEPFQFNGVTIHPSASPAILSNLAVAGSPEPSSQTFTVTLPAGAVTGQAAFQVTAAGVDPSGKAVQAKVVLSFSTLP